MGSPALTTFFLDRAEIARLINEGFTSGILDHAEVRISWVLQYAKFECR
jgi:hypothetical protein